MLTAPQLLYQARYALGEEYPGCCYVCGGRLYQPVPKELVIKSTFGDYQYMHTQNEQVCIACQWFMMQDKREDLRAWLNRDKLQSPRTYSHILKDGKWHILSKGQKANILALLTSDYMPEVCIISVMGKKHLSYRARPNPPEQSSGWVLFEEQQLWVDQTEFRYVVEHVEGLYLPPEGFTKNEILTGRYNLNPKRPLGVELYQLHEPHITSYRGGVLLDLVVYLVTKPQEMVDNETEG